MITIMDRFLCIALLGWSITVLSVPASAQTFATLHTFDAASGLSPTGGLVQGPNGCQRGFGSGRQRGFLCAATTGRVEVKTPSGVFPSNLPFRVL